MQLPENPRMKAIKICYENDWQIPEPFVDGHVLNGQEAKVLNQTFAENMRNNFATTVAEARTKEGVDADSKDEDQLTEERKGELQAELDKYVAAYEFGERRGGGVRPTDPIEAIMLDMAEDLVRKAIVREPGAKLGDYKAKDIRERAKGVLGDYETQLRQLAVEEFERQKALEAQVVVKLQEA